MSQFMELLARWHKAEPGLCGISDPTYPASTYIVQTGAESVYIAAPYADLPAIAQRIQGCVQWAIANKPDWELVLVLNRHPNGGSSPRWTSRVYRPEDAAHPFSSSPASEAAEAILEAYVMALEAGAGGEA